MTSDAEQPSVFRVGGVSYLRIPAPDARSAGAFYQSVFDEVVAHGGEIVTPPYPEGDLWVGTFRDPSGNVLGVWQTGPRA